MRKPIKIYLYGLFGNVFDHFELALYGLLAPVFAKLFFPDDSQVVAYIKSYALFPFFLFSRLLGAFYFGRIGDRKGTSVALSYTLFGMALIAFLIGVTPTGKGAFYILFLLLMLQNFFASGEKIGGVLYILENSDQKQKPLVSGIYDASSIFGYILATSFVAMLGDSISLYWRYLYVVSSVCALFGFLIRRSVAVDNNLDVSGQKIKADYKNQLSITFTVCFSYALYYITMTMMNSWIPLITNISYAKVLHMNVYLLILDVLLLPVFGYFSFRYGTEKVMLIAAYLNLFGALPLFYMLKSGSFLTVLAVRACLVFMAVMFSAPCYYYAYRLANAKKRFQTIAIANVIGAHIGKSAPVIAYWVYKKTQLIVSPALPVLVFGALALYFLRETSRQMALDTQPS